MNETKAVKVRKKTETNVHGRKEKDIKMKSQKSGIWSVVPGPKVNKSGRAQT